MGEISDMMRDGTLCQQCGGFIGNTVGYPVTCRDCQRPRTRIDLRAIGRTAAEFPIACRCGRRFKTDAAIAQHRAATGCAEKEGR